MAIGANGMYYLDEDRLEGENPLTPYGPNAAMHLRREDTFRHVADIVVNSAYDEQTNEIPAFEELVGSHGGLGGNQTRPFVLYPAELDSGADPILGACQLHLVLRRWVKQIQEAHVPDATTSGS